MSQHIKTDLRHERQLLLAYTQGAFTYEIFTT